MYLWIQDRSVFLDEANLIINIHDLSFTELTGPLLADQRAPLLFTWLSKAITSICGTSTMAYRILPLILITSSIWMFRSVAVRRHTNYIAAGLMTLYGFHELVLKYVSECKQYGADIFATILLLYLYEKWKPNKNNGLKWLLTGSFLIWLSMPSVLLLAGIGFSWLLQYKKSMLTDIRSIVLIGVGWCIALLANYYFILAPAINSEFMQSYHAEYFLDLTSWDSIERSFMVYIRLIAKKTAIGIAAVILLLTLGLTRLIKSDLSRAVLYLTPILLALFLSALGMFSLLERLVLYALPILLLVLGEGIGFVNEKVSNKLLRRLCLTIITVALAISLKYRQGIKWMAESPVEDLKTALLDMLQVDNPKQIYMSKHTYPSYHHYVHIDRLIDNVSYQRGSREHDIIQEFEPITKDTAWVLMSHVLDLEAEVNMIKARYNVIQELRSKGTVALEIVGFE